MNRTLLIVLCIVIAKWIFPAQTTIAQIPSNGLVAWYPFNGNANDESGNGNNGTVNGATLTSDRFGIGSKAYHFDGNQQNIVVTSSESLSSMSEITFSCWVKPESWFTNPSWGTLYFPIICKSNVSSSGGLFSFFLQPGGFYSYFDGYQAGFGTGDLLNTWVNLTVTVTSAKVMKCYMNGVLINEYQASVVAFPHNNNLDMIIGGDLPGQAEYAIGTIDNLAFYNRILTPLEIQQLYQDQTGQLQQTTTCLPAYVPANGLVGYWPFCGNANDESGNGNDGAVNGATLYTDRFGNQNGAYSFNGTGDYIFCGEHNQLSYSNANKISLSFWFKSASTSSNNSDPFDLRSMNNNSIQVYLNGPNANGIQLNNWNHLDWCGSSEQSTMDFIENQWQHLVEVVDFDNNTMTLYFNGQLIETMHYPGCAQLGRLTNPKLNIGSRFDMYGSRCCFFQGLMDDFGLWNRALTSQEIQALYLSGQAPCTPVSNSISATIVEGQSYTLGTQTLTTAGAYTEVFTSAAGCDSTVTLTLNVTSSCLPSYVPTNGLLGYWPFCGNANDESGNGYNGTVNGPTLTTDRFGNLNSAYSYNGTTDYITSGLATIPGNAYTISAWYNSNIAQSNEIGLVVSRTTWNVSTGLYLFDNSAYLQSTSTCDNFHYNGYSVNALNDSSWHHYLASYDGSQFKIYVDGALKSTTNSSIQMCIDANFKFGVDDLVPNRFFAGKIDDIAIYSRALSQEEIIVLYSGEGIPQILGCTDLAAFNYNPAANTDDGSCISVLTCNITTPTTTLCAGQSATLTMNTTGGAGASSQLPANLQQGLVAYYPFNGNANDESGNGNNGTVNGATLTSDRFGELSSAYSFNGAGNHILIQNSDLLNPSEMTISFYANFLSGNSAILDKVSDSDPSNFGYSIIHNYQNSEYGLYTGWNTSGSCDWPLSAGSTFGPNGIIQNNLWNHVVVTIDNSGFAKQYINGVLSHSYFGGVLNTCNSLNSKLYIGRQWAGDPCWMNGVLDDIQIYNRALSESEIQQLYTYQSFAWSTNETTPTITVSPTTNTTYSCTVTQGNQTCTASVDIMVSPTITNSVSATIVQGQSYTLGTQTLTTAGTYTEVFTSSAGCDSTVTLTLSVEPLLTCNITTPTTTLCAGQSATLTMNTTGGAGASSQLPANLQQGLVSYFPLNGNGNDFGIANNNLSSTSGVVQFVTDRFGNLASCAKFSGNGEYLSRVNPALPIGADSRTISVWYMIDENSNGPVIFSQNSSLTYGSCNSSFSLFSGIDGPYFWGRCNDRFWNNGFNLGEWQNLVFVYSDPMIFAYLNGVLINSSVDVTSYFNVGSLSTSNEIFSIGGSNVNNGAGWPTFLNGKVDDLFIWNRALSSTEIQQLYTAQSYAWSTNETTPTITVSPTTNTTYSCTVTQGNQTCTASVDIMVSPTITNSVSATIVQGQSYTLGTQTLTTAGTYTEVFTSAAGCDSTVTLTLSVEPLLTCNITTPTTTLCAGQSATLTMNTTGGAGASSQLPANLQQGLVAYYPFNGNANDESGNGNNGTVNGAQAIMDRYGNTVEAFAFDGLNSGINFSNNFQFHLIGDASISLWIKPEVSQNYQGSILFSSLGSVDFNRYNFYLRTNGNTTIALDYKTFIDTHYFVETIPFATGVWSNVVLTRLDNTYQLFVNGVLQSSGIDSSPNLPNSAGWTLGNDNASGSDFIGSLDDIAIYNRALSLSEIQQLYTAQTYAWSTNATTPTITVSPTTNTTYSCTVTQGNQTCTASVDIMVSPTITNSVSATIVQGQSYTLGTQTLTTAGTYTEVFTSSAGCDSTVTLTLSVEPLLTCNITTPTTTLCAGQSATLTVNNAIAGNSSSALSSGLAQNLLAQFSFDGNVSDLSGNNIVAQNYGATPIVDRSGQNNGALHFNGNAWVKSLIINTNVFSISTWFKWSGSNNGGGSACGSCGCIWRADNSISASPGLAFLRTSGSSSLQTSSNSSVTITPNVWYHSVVVKNGSIYQLYLNGQLVLESPHGNVNANLWLNIGRGFPNGSYEYFIGDLDDFLVFDSAITSSQVLELYGYSGASANWSTNATTPTITVSPTTSTTYSCTVTQGNQTCTASVDITVNPAITNAVSTTIVEGQSYTLGTQTLTTAGTYTEVFTSAAGCDSTVTLTLAVEPLLTCNITSPITTLCAGQSATLTMNTTGGAGSSSQLPTNLQQGLVAYYPFNGNANDESGNGNNLSNNGAMLTTDRFGNAGQSYIFNGAQWMQSTSSQFNALNQFSLVFWYKSNSFNGNTEYIMHKGCESSLSQGVSFRVSKSTIMWGDTWTNSNGRVWCNSTQSADTSWHQMVMSYDNQLMYIYIDGVLSGQSGQFGSLSTNSNPLYLGAKVQNADCAKAFFYNGKLDDVLIYNRSISPSEIQQLFTAQSYAWSTNATTPTITVSPTTNTTYNCTVTSGSQTCTASIDITVNPQQTYFADADGDGYGNPNVVVSNCNQPTGYVTNNTDCNDNNASVHTSTTETCNGLDDNCNGQIDEGLTQGSVTAIPVTTNVFPTCSGNGLKAANLNTGNNSSIIDGNGLDLWYSLTAQYNTLRAGLSAAFGDNEIRLYQVNNGCFQLIQTEHEVYTTTTQGTGNQVLISDELIPGQTYYVAVHNISGAMNTSAKICFNHFVESTCDHYYSNYTGIYPNVCSSFKAQYKGNASNYIFNILSATQNNQNMNITPWSYATGSALSVVSRIGSIFPVNMSSTARTYTLNVPVVYSIPDAAGNYTSITANGTSTCTVTMSPETTIALRSLDRCPNIKTTSSSVSIDRTICGALRYEWEFTQQLPTVQPAVTVLGGLNSSVLFLNNVPGMGLSKTYNVRVRPVHANGEVGSWGSVQCLKTGSSGMVLDHPGSAGAVQWANSGTEQWASGTEQWANNYSPELEVRFTLYPNPTNNGRFTLTASNTSDEEVKNITMTDITGKIVYKTQVVLNGNAVEIEFGNLASGVYVVMVGEERLRLVVQ